MRRGMHHIGLATTDYEATVEFYTKVIGWEIAWQDQHEAPDGTVAVRHVFFDTGDGSYVAFMAPTPAIPGVPETWDTGINAGLGLPPIVYHFAFWRDTREELEELQARIRDHGVEATELMDHDGWTLGFCVRDPNGLLIEFACTTRELTEDDKRLKFRGAPRVPTHEGRPDLEARDAAIIMNISLEDAKANLDKIKPKEAPAS